MLIAIQNPLLIILFSLTHLFFQYDAQDVVNFIRNAVTLQNTQLQARYIFYY